MHRHILEGIGLFLCIEVEGQSVAKVMVELRVETGRSFLKREGDCVSIVCSKMLKIRSTFYYSWGM